MFSLISCCLCSMLWYISIWSMSEQNEDHSMDVREFVIAFSVVCRPAKTLDTIRLAFQVRWVDYARFSGAIEWVQWLVLVSVILQMFEADEDGAIIERELMCILRTALGVGELKVSRLFRAIDEEDSGKISFGKRFHLFVLLLDFSSHYLRLCRW